MKLVTRPSESAASALLNQRATVIKTILILFMAEMANDRTDRCGRPVALELETDAARPRSVE